jgi:hypothetical protein
MEIGDSDPHVLDKQTLPLLDPARRFHFGFIGTSCFALPAMTSSSLHDRTQG